LAGVDISESMAAEIKESKLGMAGEREKKFN
jgi:hypothetical protein